ncbi:hypothetical protein [Poriferisphaera sp. WC338]|uniref:hypothetical protein n=1 Tax=Poriferisphaera sp. WC338 TaxID=3425129 RepID=UPI003D819AA4
MNIAVPMMGGKFGSNLAAADRLVVYRIDRAGRRVCTIDVQHVDPVEGKTIDRLIQESNADSIIVSREFNEIDCPLLHMEIDILLTQASGYPEQIINQYLYHPDYFTRFAPEMAC